MDRPWITIAAGVASAEQGSSWPIADVGDLWHAYLVPNLQHERGQLRLAERHIVAGEAAITKLQADIARQQELGADTLQAQAALSTSIAVLAEFRRIET